MPYTKKIRTGASLFVAHAGFVLACEGGGGACIYDEVSFAEVDATPWGTSFEEDALALSGEWSGVLEWKTGGVYVDVARHEDEDVRITIIVDPESAHGQIGSTSPESRLFCADTYSLRASLGLWTSSVSLEGNIPVSISRIDGEVSGYTINEPFEASSLVRNNAFVQADDAATFETFGYFILLHWSSGYTELEGEIYASGTDHDSGSNSGTIAFSKIAEFRATQSGTAP